ncbi:MAG: hypothetical protein LBQ35_00750 [Spirochaetaceae bacterium]|nr:hypothetical protein [Spirochaetaceae bacterium]
MGIFPGANLDALRREGCEILDYRLARKEGDWAGWFDVSVGLHGLTETGVGRLRAAILDFPRYSRTFKRCLGALAAESGGETVLDAQLGVKILGFTFGARLVCLVTRYIDTEETFDVIFTQREDFSTLYGAYGEWYFRRVEIDGRPYTYYRFTASSAVLNKFALQEWIMSAFGPGEFRDFAAQLVRAAGRN